eukprot:scaffold7651_cov135-Skeletonema_dohrnii-CCMP3373.AAC.4
MVSKKGLYTKMGRGVMLADPSAAMKPEACRCRVAIYCNVFPLAVAELTKIVLTIKEVVDTSEN